MLVIFINILGIVHHEFTPQGQTVNTEVYYNVLKHVMENIWHQDGNWVLHRDNAPFLGACFLATPA